MTPEALEAERIAIRFGLAYLSREGFEKVVRLIVWVRSGRPLPAVEHPADIIKPPLERVGWPPLNSRVEFGGFFLRLQIHAMRVYLSPWTARCCPATGEKHDQSDRIR